MEEPKGQDVEEPELPASLMTLPPEVIQEIIRKVEDEDLLSLRLVAPYLKANIDEGYGITADLQDELTKKMISFLGTTVIRETTLGDVTCMNFHTLFFKPLRLKIVSFNNITSTTFFMDLLTTCTKIQDLYMYGRILGLIKAADEDKVIRLPHLRNLDVRMAKCADSYNESYHCTENTLNVLRHVYAPKLKSLCIEIWVIGPSDVDEATLCFMEFLARHINLHKIFFCTRLRPQHPEGIPLQEFYSRTIPIISVPDQINRMRVISQDMQLRIILISFKSEDPLWLTFLNGQKRLEKIGLCDTAGVSDWTLAVIPIKQNWATLKTLYILSVLRASFDFTSLKECKGLKELLLINSPDNMMVNLPEGHLINFCISESWPQMEFLALSMMTINHRNLEQILQMKNLKYLGLLDVGMGLNVGVDLELMKEFPQMRSLEGLLINGVVANGLEDVEQIATIMKLFKPSEEEENDAVINIRDIENTSNRRWTKQREGFVFDIDFYNEV